jgi:hypothetical protein
MKNKFLNIEMIDINDFLDQDIETILKYEREDTPFLFTLHNYMVPVVGRLLTYPHYMSGKPQVEYIVVWNNVHIDIDQVESIGTINLKEI